MDTRRTALVTGSTDGIGLEAARLLVAAGHRVLVHGRSPERLDAAVRALSGSSGTGSVSGYLADLSRLAEADALARAVAEQHRELDVLVNNAGVFRTPDTRTDDGLDVRFAVNAIAPYLIARRLTPDMPSTGRVVNVASAGQAPVDLDALAGRVRLSDWEAYAQSKLALIMWSRRVAGSLAGGGPVVVAVNPGSMLGTKMVREGFGVPGADVGIGAEALARAAVGDDFGDASGRYYDNDQGRFASPHPDALDPERCRQVVRVIESVLIRQGLAGGASPAQD